MKESTELSSDELKSCCAQLYENDVVRLLVGDSFHPGGLNLTSTLGETLKLTEDSRVLDVASGKGTSALHLSKRFGCEVVGIDYSADNVQTANESAERQGLQDRVEFEEGDSERLPFEGESFDAIICECAFCTFPDKAAAAGEFHRVLKPGGRVGLSDITRKEQLPGELRSLMAWVACIADAQPVEGYTQLLTGAGFRIDGIVPHDEALTEMVQKIRMKLFGLEIAVGLKKLELPGIDFTNAKDMVNRALAAINRGQLGYAIVSAIRS